MNWQHLPQSHSASDESVTDCSAAVTTNHPGTPRAGKWLEIEQIDYLRLVMQDEHLTADECNELSQALRQDAAALPNGSKKENLLKLAECYGDLAEVKRWFLRKVN
jgi:hypothetical protein